MKPWAYVPNAMRWAGLSRAFSPYKNGSLSLCHCGQVPLSLSLRASEARPAIPFCSLNTPDANYRRMVINDFQGIAGQARNDRGGGENHSRFACPQ
jgi:hypothetical protein